jgi:hypothetical protein
MGGESKLRKWMEAHGHSYESLAGMLGITPLHKLVHLTGLDHEDFLLPEELRELRRMRRQTAA